MGSTVEPGGFIATAGPTVKPLAPYVLQGAGAQFAGALHDQIFGWKKGDTETGDPAHTKYVSDQLGSFDYYTNPIYATMVSNDSQYKVFKAAVAAGIVPNTAIGLETLLGRIGDGPVTAPVDFWQWYESFLTGGKYNGIPAGQPGSLSGPGIINPVTGQFISQSLIVAGYPKTDQYDTTTLLLTDGRSWSWYSKNPKGANPNTTPAYRTGKIDTQIILNVSLANPNSPLNAIRGIVYFSDGSTSDDPASGHVRPEFTGRGQWAVSTLNEAELRKIYDVPPNLRVISVVQWSSLTKAEQIAVGTDLQAVNGFNPATQVVQPSTSIYAPHGGGGTIDAPVRPDPSLPTQGPNNGVTGVPTVTVYSPPPPPAPTPTFLPAVQAAPAGGNNALWELLGVIAILFFLA